MKITPIGYSNSSIGRWFGLFIVMAAGVIMALLLKSGASAADMKYFAIVAVVLAIFFALSDIMTNLKSQKKISRMNYLLDCPAVKGEIKEIKLVPYFFGRIMPEHAKIHVKRKDKVYQIVATFQDAKTGSEKTVVSAPYARDPRVFFSEDFVNVHYSPDGDYWIEPNEFDATAPSAEDESKNLRFRRLVERHGAVLTLSTIAFALVLLVITYLIIT